MRRTPLPTASLYALLNREFQKHRPPACRACRVPLPYRCDPVHEGAANWQIGTPPRCPHGCGRVIEELVRTLGAQYELEPPLRSGGMSGG